MGRVRMDRTMLWLQEQKPSPPPPCNWYSLLRIYYTLVGDRVWTDSPAKVHSSLRQRAGATPPDRFICAIWPGITAEDQPGLPGRKSALAQQGLHRAEGQRSAGRKLRRRQPPVTSLSYLQTTPLSFNMLILQKWGHVTPLSVRPHVISARTRWVSAVVPVTHF